MNTHNPIPPEQEKEEGFDCPAFVEPLLLFIAIIFVTLLLGTMQMQVLGTMQMQDEKAKQAEIQKEYLAKCHWHQPRMITEFDCVVINEKLAVIK